MDGEDRYIGKQIGNYRITTALDSGSFGRVYKGVHRYLTHRIVAIKIMHLTHLGSAEEREGFLKEAQFLEMLKHPHVLPIYDVGIDEGFPYIVAEFASNGSLRERLRDLQPKLLPADVSLQVLAEVGQALQYVHEQNIVHRDLKPENILFNTGGEAMIADFGIAVFLETTKTQYANVLGSPLYMAPEQFDGIASRRSDQYSLACIAYELFTGRPPFVAAHTLSIGMKHQQEQPLPPSQLNPDIPHHVEYAILKGLAKKRENRYADISAFLSALLTIPTGSLPRSKEELLEEGYRLFNAKRYRAALTAFERAAKRDPMFADAYEGMGATLFSLERTKEALAAYEHALRLNPSYASAYNGKGNILYDMGRYEEALAAYEKAVQQDDNFVDAHVGKGNALYYLGHYDEAIIEYNQAIQLDPRCVDAHNGKGWVLWHAKRFQDALVAFEQAIRIDPNNVSSYIGKGKSLYHLGNYNGALQCFEQAIKLTPEDDRSYEYKADALYRLRQYEDALAAYEQSIELNPNVASSHEGKAWVLMSLERYKEALSPYERAIVLNPNAAFPHNGKGNALYELGRYEEALAAYEKAITLNPKLAAAYNGKGNALADLMRYEEALAAYEKATQLQSRTGAFHYNKANVLKRLGQNEEAEHEFNVARQLGYVVH